MELINITVKKKIAYDPKETIVCGNKDYAIRFIFDDEWSAYPTKTARFSYNGTHEDIPFSGDTVEVPKLRKVQQLEVGVFTEDISTVGAVIKCKYDITSKDGAPATPSEDVYSLLMKEVNDSFKEVNELIGDIGDALDELHEYAQQLIDGGEA